MLNKNSSTSKARVLIVDNDPVMRLLMREALSDNNYIIGEAESGLPPLAATGKAERVIFLYVSILPKIMGFRFSSRFRKK